MEQKTDRLYPSAPVENNDLKQRLEKKLNVCNNFINHISNIKEIITYFKDKNNKSKEKFKNYNLLTAFLKSFDTSVITARTSSSITLSQTEIGFLFTHKSISIVFALSFSNKLVCGLITQKYQKCRKQYEKDQETKKSFDKLYRRFLQDKIIDKNEYERLYNSFTKYLDETKHETFL